LYSVFVYGTLKKGFPNHDRIFPKYEIKITEAWVYGVLFDLGWGFPAMVIDHELGENNKVCGEVIEFRDPWLLVVLDRLEGFKSPDNRSNYYDRIKKTVHMQSGKRDSWVYVLNEDRIDIAGFKKLPSGVWG